MPPKALQCTPMPLPGRARRQLLPRGEEGAGSSSRAPTRTCWYCRVAGGRRPSPTPARTATTSGHGPTGRPDRSHAGRAWSSSTAGAANPCGSTGRCGAVTHEPRRPCSDRRSFRPSPRRQARRITSSSSSSDRRPSTMPSTVTAGLPPSARKPSVHSTSRHAAQRAKPSSRTTEGAMSASDRRSSSQEQLRTWARQPYADAAQEAAPSPVRPPSRPSQVGTPRL